MRPGLIPGLNSHLKDRLDPVRLGDVDVGAEKLAKYV
jgi:hypothetical protein